MTRPDMSIKVERQLHDMRILGRIVGVRSTEQFVRHLLPPTSNGAFMNIYNIDQFQKNEYSWNPVSKRRARNYYIKLGVGVALIFALYGLLGYFLFVTHAFVTQTLWGYGAAMVILAFGLRLALNAGSRKQTRKMSLDEKHDYALYFYHRHGRKNAVLGNFYLVICAQADVCQRKYELAEQALEQIVMEKCKADQLKQIWLLRLIIALAIDDEEKIQETFICYNGIEVRSKDFQLLILSESVWITEMQKL